ncbi:MAG: hypothetical protein JO182_03745 [Acidobacteriaceae bacterium]|nr:hypothetical protein [Acidobacteriaceae bacterium]MBV9226184.1 hypothetical protein [Acidobacteriaceae bacterium]MBV9678599.1 hypothetical protein [Acidobacteriaceae bacterium]
MTLNERELNNLLCLLMETEESEIDCDHCLSRVGQFAEAQLVGRTHQQALEEVRQHLAVCLDCREEYEALLAGLESLRQ